MDPRQQLADRLSREARRAAAQGNEDEAKKLRAKMQALYDEMERNLDTPSDFNSTPQYQRQEEATR